MTVYFRPCGEITAAPAPRSQEDADLYAYLSEKTGLKISYMPEIFVDYEDWMEPICMLEQSLRAGLETVILPRKALMDAVRDPIATIPGNRSRDILIGRLLERDPDAFKHFDFGWPARGEGRVNHYAELETFQRYAGRGLRLADMPGDIELARTRDLVFDGSLVSQPLGEAMAAFAPGSVIVKQVYPAKELPLLTYDLDKDFSPEDASGLFFDRTGFHAMRFEGDPAALLVQEKITMTHETRFFVIGGKVVSGGACIESDTPQVNRDPSEALLPRWETIRNGGETDTRSEGERIALAQRLWAFAHAVALDIAGEAPELTAYALDVAIDAEGKPLVIELNPACSSGFYGNNAERLFSAIVEYAETVESQTPEPVPEVSPTGGGENKLSALVAGVLSGIDLPRGNEDELEDEPFVEFDTDIDFEV